MKSPAVTLLLALSLAGAGALQARTALTWDDCVKEASEKNPDLLTARQNLKAAENSQASSFGQFLPQVSLGANLGRSGKDNSLDGILSDPSYSQNAGYSLSLHQQIFSGGKDVSSVDSADSQVRIARAQLTATKAQLSRDLTGAFYGLLFSKRQVDLLRTIAERSRSNAKLVELHYKGGADNKGSFLQAQASSLQADLEAAQAERSLRAAQRVLAHLLGRGPQEDLEAQGEFELPDPPSSVPDFQALSLKVPSYLLALEQLRAAENRLVSTRGDFFPSLSANASFSKSGADFSSLSPSWNAGLSLSLPLFSGGSDIFDFKAAEESKKGAEFSLQQSANSAYERLESSFIAFQNALDKVGVQRAFREAAETREQIAKAQYLNGLLTFQNWDQIETELTNQQKSELSSLLNARTAQADWELSQGKGAIP